MYNIGQSTNSSCCVEEACVTLQMPEMLRSCVSTNNIYNNNNNNDNDDNNNDNNNLILNIVYSPENAQMHLIYVI